MNLRNDAAIGRGESVRHAPQPLPGNRALGIDERAQDRPRDVPRMFREPRQTTASSGIPLHMIKMTDPP